MFGQKLVRRCNGVSVGAVMRFGIYGRYELEVVRQGSAWAVYRVERNRRRPESNVVVPPDVPEAEIQTYLDDLLHELARPGTAIERLD